MQTLKDFHNFYNQTINPELRRMNQRRKKMLRSLVFIFVFILALFFLQIWFNVFFVFLIFIIPMLYFVSTAFIKLDEYRATYKPKIISLVLDFIDNDPYFGTEMKYNEQASISKETFLVSKLFNTEAPEFVGEDYITGTMGELEFEMSELGVKEFSPVRTRLDNVFRGIFLHARYTHDVQNENGAILLLPRSKKSLISRTIKAFTVKGARQIELPNQQLRDLFLVYATSDANKNGFLSNDMQRAIVEYAEKTGRDIFISFIRNDIYIAVENEKNLFEPRYLESSVSYELIHEFYQDINILLNIIRDIDANN